jgi:hypothetical protein
VERGMHAKTQKEYVLGNTDLRLKDHPLDVKMYFDNKNTSSFVYFSSGKKEASASSCLPD